MLGLTLKTYAIKEKGKHLASQNLDTYCFGNIYQVLQPENKGKKCKTKKIKLITF